MPLPSPSPKSSVHTPHSTHPLTSLLQTPNSLRPLLSLPLILQHPRIFPDIISLDLQSSVRGDCLEDEMVVAVGAVLVALVKLLDVLAEALFAFLAGKDHFEGGFQSVGLGFGVAFGAVEPFLAWVLELA